MLDKFSNSNVSLFSNLCSSERERGINMEYVGFMMLLFGAAGMDSSPIIAGAIAVGGAVILLIKQKTRR